jgi:hypothetical protein
MLMTDHDRISMNSESIRLAYEAILEILDRLDALEGVRDRRSGPHVERQRSARKISREATGRDALGALTCGASSSHRAPSRRRATRR